MKRKVRREPLGLRRINAPLVVPDDEHCGGRLPVFVEHVKSHFAGRQTVEQHIYIVAITDVLRPLPDVERNLSFALARVAAVKLEDAIFEAQAAQPLAQRLFAEHLQIEPQLGRIRLRRIAALAINLVRRRGAPAAFIQGERVRADRAQFGGHAGFVVDFHEELAPAFFDQFRLRGSRRDFHARFRIDVHAEQAILVQHVLDGLAGFVSVGLLQGGFQRLFIGLAERCPEIIRCFDHASDLRDERLQLGILDDGQTRRITGGDDQGHSLERAEERWLNDKTFVNHSGSRFLFRFHCFSYQRQMGQ